MSQFENFKPENYFHREKKIAVSCIQSIAPFELDKTINRRLFDLEKNIDGFSCVSIQWQFSPGGTITVLIIYLFTSNKKNET